MPPNRGATVLLPRFLFRFICLPFLLFYPAHRIYMCFLPPDLFSAYETCFRLSALVEVSRRFRLAPAYRHTCFAATSLATTYIFCLRCSIPGMRHSLSPPFSLAYVLADDRPCLFPLCSSVFTSWPSRVPRHGPLALPSR